MLCFVHMAYAGRVIELSTHLRLILVLDAILVICYTQFVFSSSLPYLHT